MRIRPWIMLGLCWILTGCATSRHLGLSEDQLPAGDSVFFDQPERHQARLEAFVSEHHEVSEGAKIHYLLSAIRASEGIFIRNGIEYNGVAATGWLKWKATLRRYKSEPIRDARDYISRVATRSEKTGIPYRYETLGGEMHTVAKILYYELIALEASLRTKMVETPVVVKKSPVETQAPQTLDVPVILAAPVTT